MANNPIYLNGVQFKPSGIEESDDRIGETSRMANGTLRMYHRAFKKTWEIRWDGIPTAILNQVRVVYRNIGQFTFINEQGESYTVITPAGGFNSVLDAADGAAIGGETYYKVRLTLEQV